MALVKSFICRWKRQVKSKDGFKKKPRTITNENIFFRPYTISDATYIHAVVPAKPKVGAFFVFRGAKIK